jgi:RimJ/RimL family protein N-acetyltransferase
MNADSRVMEYFPGIKSRSESEKEMKALQEHIEKYGWGFWAASLGQTGEWIGLIGLKHVSIDAHFTPAVEVGWRLDPTFWGKGYATEGAHASLKYGFEVLNLPEIVSYTSTQNIPSRRVMERIGMSHDPKDDFDHPRLAVGHPLSRHVLYRLKRADFLKVRYGAGKEWGFNGEPTAKKGSSKSQRLWGKNERKNRTYDGKFGGRCARADKSPAGSGKP